MQRILLNLVPKWVEDELNRIYDDPSEIIDFWNRTQVREAQDAGEMEDVFYGL